MSRLMHRNTVVGVFTAVAAVVVVTTALAQVLTVRPSPTMFDPFNPSIQTTSLSPTTAPSDTLDSGATQDDPTLARPPVRDPYRPPVRSAIRP